MVGPGRLELPTSRLSGVRSNHLSYGPLPAAVIVVAHARNKVPVRSTASATARRRSFGAPSGASPKGVRREDMIDTVRHPERKRNEGGGCRLFMHDRDLTDPVFVPMKGYESVAIFLA